MLRPPHLLAGDKVALISPAGGIDPSVVTNGEQVLRSWGLEPVAGSHATCHCGYFAGSDADRLADLQWALDNEEIRAIICTRGGYGTIRIVEQADYSVFQGNPKWVVGFSDITVLHTKLTALGIESLHAPMPKSYAKNTPEALSYLKQYLFGDPIPYHIAPHPLNRTGIAEADLTGGNLSLIHCLRSTSVEYQPEGSILFLEDVGENLYAIDRMMQSLKLSGRLSQIHGLIVGSFTDMKGENFGNSAEEIIRETVDEYDYPVCFGFPAGHIAGNFPLIIGATIELNVDAAGSEIEFT